MSTDWILQPEGTDWLAGCENTTCIYAIYNRLMNSTRRQKDMTLEDRPPRSVGVQFPTGEEWRNRSRKKEKKRLCQSGDVAQLWMCLVVKVKSDAVKNNIVQEPAMLVPWRKENWKWSNRRWQEWISIDIFGISELKWIAMGEFNSDGHYTVGKNPLEGKE